MTLSVEAWKKMPEMTLPWVGKETGFTLTEVRGLCEDCGSELHSLRGNIYEAYGVVEMDMGGVCPLCNHLVHCRSRVYPKKGVFAQETVKGWESVRMITFNDKWLLATKGMLKPMSVGILISIAATFIGAKGPMEESYIWWGMMSLGLFGLAVFGGWVIAKLK